MSNILILAVETSCDETAVSVLQFQGNDLTILANEVSSQVKLHAKWGGVVPNLAAREHVKNIVPIFKLALKNAGVSMQDIDFIAVTEGPGLIPALMVGNNFAKTLAYLWGKPLIGIHHIEGHIYANFVREMTNDKFQMTKAKKLMTLKANEAIFPVLCLVVSGGHTQLVLMKDHLKYEIIGQTLDDAVGEAFDKVARILGIGYPGGPVVAQRAMEFPMTNDQFPNKSQKSNSKSKEYEIQDTRYEIQFPRPMLNKQGFNFSFSGLKTAVLYETKKHPELLSDKKYIAAVCHEFQQATIDVLIAKTLKAAEKFKPKTIMLAGGVSANKELREQMGTAISKSIPNTKYCIPDTSLTGDNAAMIAAAAAFRWQKMNESQKKKALNGWENLQPYANLKLK